MGFASTGAFFAYLLMGGEQRKNGDNIRVGGKICGNSTRKEDEGCVFLKHF